MIKKAMAALVIGAVSVAAHAFNDPHGFADGHTPQWQSIGGNDSGEYFIDLKGVGGVEGENMLAPLLIYHSNGLREQLVIAIHCTDNTYSSRGEDSGSDGYINHKIDPDSPASKAYEMLCKPAKPVAPVSHANKKRPQNWLSAGVMSNGADEATIFYDSNNVTSAGSVRAITERWDFNDGKQRFFILGFECKTKSFELRTAGDPNDPNQQMSTASPGSDLYKLMVKLCE